MTYRDFDISTDPYCTFPDEYIVGIIKGWEPVEDDEDGSHRAGGDGYFTGPTVENVKAQIDDYWTEREA